MSVTVFSEPRRGGDARGGRLAADGVDLGRLTEVSCNNFTTVSSRLLNRPAHLGDVLSVAGRTRGQVARVKQPRTSGHQAAVAHGGLPELALLQCAERHNRRQVAAPKVSKIFGARLRACSGGPERPQIELTTK